VQYRPTGRSDELGCRALTDAADTLKRPLVIGAWMTRAWVLESGASQAPRSTNDVDIAAEPEVGGSGGAAALLHQRGYRQDQLGYRFRYSLSTKAGVRIIDLMVDEKNASAGEIAFPVYGLDVATETTVDMSIHVVGIGTADIRIPGLDGAFLLRSLALADGAGGLKFEDYARDAWSIGQLLVRNGNALASWRARDGEVAKRAREIAVPLFSSPTGPGPLAVARALLGDPDLIARQVSETMLELLT